MLLDARNSSIELDREADFAIIGGGVAGITLARRLATRHRVVIAESGGLTPEAETQALYAGGSSGIEYSLEGSRLRFLGGSSNHWGGWCSPYEREDFERHDWIEHSGWPIARAALATHLAEAAGILDLGGSSFDIEPALSAAPELAGFARDEIGFRMYRFSNPVTRFGEKYRGWLQRQRDVAVLLNANLVGLDMDAGARITGARIRTLTGRAGRLRARHYVLACGGIENARLLLAINRNHGDRLGNHGGCVGRFFMEHPHIVLARLAPHDRQWCQRQRALYRDGGHWYGLGMRLRPKALERRRCLDFTAHFFNRECEAGTRIELGAMTAQAPNPASRVRLDSEVDALAMPRAHLQWRLTELDWHSMRACSEALGRHLGMLGAGRARIPDWLRDRDPGAIAYGAHHMGTTRMADAPSRGVVDADCRVFGTSNLHVAGSSVFSTAGAVNPTLTLTALTLRLGAHLLDRV